MSVRRAQDERIEGTPDGLNAITEIPDVPDAPTIGTVTVSGTTASVPYTAAVTGGPVTTFTATSSPGSITNTGSSPISISGLTGGVTYIFTVAGTNSTATGPSSASSNSITAVSPYYVGLLGSTGSDFYPTQTILKGSNLYMTGRVYSYGGTIVKLDLYGTIAWQNQISLSEPMYMAAVDSSGNVYCVGGNNNGATGHGIFIKYNSSGTQQFSKLISTTEGLYGINIDSSDNIYVSTSSIISGSRKIGNLKLNSAGSSVTWQNFWVKDSNSWNTGQRIDSSGNAYATAYGGNTMSGLALKHDTSGTTQWRKEILAGGNNPALAGDTAIDSSGNVYVTGWTSRSYSGMGGSQNLFLFKLNSGGTKQWQRALGSSATDDSGTLACDSSGNIYMTASTSSTSPSSLLLFKYNSSGTIQWQRKFSGSAAITGGWCSLSSDGSIIYITGTTTIGGTNKAFIAAVPTDGSKTGTYSISFGGSSYSITYAAASLTETTGVDTIQDSAYGDSNPGLSISSNSHTDSNPSYTSATGQVS